LGVDIAAIELQADAYEAAMLHPGACQAGEDCQAKALTISRRLEISRLSVTERRMSGLVAFYGDAHSLISSIAETERAVPRDRIDSPAIGGHASSLRFHDSVQIRSRFECAIFDGQAEAVADDEPTRVVHRLERISFTASASGHGAEHVAVHTVLSKPERWSLYALGAKLISWPRQTIPLALTGPRGRPSDAQPASNLHLLLWIRQE
jgi:hypothetical protein